MQYPHPIKSFKDNLISKAEQEIDLADQECKSQVEIQRAEEIQASTKTRKLSQKCQI